MNVSLLALILLMVSHWVGDYLLQGNVMAAKKSTSLEWLTIHVLIYTAVLMIVCLIWIPWKTAVLFSLFNGCLHFLTDFITSKFTNRFKDIPRLFFLIIGFDQLIHAITLISTYYVLIESQT